MPKLIEYYHPYQIKNIKSINEYLFLLKNILRIISKSKVQQKVEGINFPVRWSIKNNCWVVDFGSDKTRDIEGIHLNNLSFFYNEKNELFNSIVHILNKTQNSKKIESLGLKFNLFKNENRFFNFILSNNKIYHTGLYNRCQSKKRIGIYSAKKAKSLPIDDSEEFIKMIALELDFIDLQSFYDIKIDYKKEYNKFIDFLGKEELEFKINKNENQVFLIKDYFLQECEIKKYEIIKFQNCIKKVSNFNSSDLIQFLILQITLLFNNFILKSLNSEKCSAIIVKDKDSLKNIKIVNKFNVDFKYNEKLLNIPLMPLSF